MAVAIVASRAVAARDKRLRTGIAGRSGMIRISCVLVLVLVLPGCTDGPTPAACPLSVAELCATSSLPCPPTFAAALETASWGGCGSRSAQDSPLVVKYCGAVNVVEMWGIDASTNYYYDATSGELLSVTSHLAIRDDDRCVAGVPLDAVCGEQPQHDLCP